MNHFWKNKHTLFLATLITATQAVKAQQVDSVVISPYPKHDKDNVEAASAKNIKHRHIDYKALSSSNNLSRDLKRLQDSVVHNLNEYMEVDKTLEWALDSAFIKKMNSDIPHQAFTSTGVSLTAYFADETQKEVKAIGFDEVESFEMEYEGRKYTITDTTNYVDKDQDGFGSFKDIVRKRLDITEAKGTKNEISLICVYLVVPQGDTSSYTRMVILRKEAHQKNPDPDNAPYSVTSDMALRDFTYFALDMVGECSMNPPKVFRHTVKELQNKY
jgi:hypothetical protein